MEDDKRVFFIANRIFSIRPIYLYLEKQNNYETGLFPLYKAK